MADKDRDSPTPANEPPRIRPKHSIFSIHSFVSLVFPFISLVGVLTFYYAYVLDVQWSNYPWKLYYFALFAKGSLVLAAVSMVLCMFNLPPPLCDAAFCQRFFFFTIGCSSLTWGIFLLLDCAFLHPDEWTLLPFKIIVLAANILISIVNTFSIFQAKRHVEGFAILIQCFTAFLFLWAVKDMKVPISHTLSAAVWFYIVLAVAWFYLPWLKDAKAEVATGITQMLAIAVTSTDV